MNEAEKVAAFYNRNFFEEKDPISAEVEITITDKSGERISMRGVKAFAFHSIDQIVKSWYQFLLTSPDDIVNVAPEQKKAPEAPLNVDIIDYRKNRYSVLELKTGEVIVKNIDTGSEIDSKSPTHAAVMKRYKEQSQTG